MKPLFLQDSTSLLFSFKAMDSLLNIFNLSNKEKVSLLDSMQQSFKAEFEASKTLRKELDKNFRVLLPEIKLTLTGLNHDLQPLVDIIEVKETKVKELVSTIKLQSEVSESSYLSSLIHMMINRQYTSRQREYELLIYDHLHRFYKIQYLKINANAFP